MLEYLFEILVSPTLKTTSDEARQLPPNLLSNWKSYYPMGGFKNETSKALLGYDDS
jgi:hypothetical protein